MIGSFGTKLIFETSADVIRTLDKLTRKTAAKTTRHTRVNQPDKLQFTGRDLDTVSFEMLLSVDLGVNPMATIEVMRTMIKTGEVNILRIGQTTYGKFMINDMSDNPTEVDNFGNILKATVSVSMLEYV